MAARIQVANQLVERQMAKYSGAPFFVVYFILLFTGGNRDPWIGHQGIVV